MKVVIFLSLLFVFSSAKKNESVVCLSKLPELIKKELETSQEWYWGISAIGKRKGEDNYEKIFNWNDKKWLNPASTNKLPTTFSALEKLGRNFQFETKLFTGDSKICIELSGDPSFSYDNLFFLLSEASYEMNHGDTVYIDSSIFGKYLDEYPGSWQANDLTEHYCARPISEILNINTESILISPGKEIGDSVRVRNSFSPIELSIDVEDTKTIEGNRNNLHYRMNFAKKNPFEIIGTIGIDNMGTKKEIAIPNPQNHFKKTTKFFLEKLGIRNTTVDHTKKCKMLEGMKLKSRNLSDKLINLANYTLQVSDNTFAELFLLQLGAKRGFEDEETAFKAGLNEISSILYSKGIEKDSFSQRDGSGVSRQTFASAKMLTDLLLIGKQNNMGLEHIMPLAGMSGSLKNRFLDHKGILTAKTGSLTGVNALSGYVLHSEFYEDIIFAIIENSTKMTAVEIRKLIDRLALLFAFTNPSC